jgi:hypothetical protein
MAGVDKTHTPRDDDTEDGGGKCRENVNEMTPGVLTQPLLARGTMGPLCRERVMSWQITARLLANTLVGKCRFGGNLQAERNRGEGLEFGACFTKV